MVRIKKNEETLTIRVEGHAGYAEKGKDIVCSAVSILLYAYAAELLKQGISGELRDDGEVLEITPSRPTEQARIAFETAVTGLGMLAETYEGYVYVEGGD